MGVRGSGDGGSLGGRIVSAGNVKRREEQAIRRKLSNFHFDEN